jgi:DNA invertase Pin-like site-specific DNA recombinase
VLTLAYCRVSTEEQAEEGWSIEGQTDKLRAYASLHDLGEITVVSDPGLSGKNMLRPGLQQLLAAVEAGHVTHVVVWKLDRLSRNLRDLMELRDTFELRGVTLHSVSENLDLSSPSGRWFFSMMGGQAEYYRDALAENVRMGNARAHKEGRHINRPKFGYDLVDKFLVPNDNAPIVREIFRLRREGVSLVGIEDATGVKASTVKTIIESRVYQGKIKFKKEWLPGVHEPIITEAEWRAAQRAHTKGVRRSKDPLSGRVICGLCGRKMSVMQNGKGSVFYRCWHRGKGCELASKSTRGIGRAAVNGLGLIGRDDGLREAIRRRLSGRGPDAAAPRRTRRAAPGVTLKSLSDDRHKLLHLYYRGKISEDLVHEEETRLAIAIEAMRHEAVALSEEVRAQTDLEARFGEVAALLSTLDIDTLWEAAEDRERRVIIENMVESVTVFPDHLEVKIVGSPALHVLYSEVGLKGSENVQVGGPA